MRLTRGFVKKNLLIKWSYTFLVFIQLIETHKLDVFDDHRHDVEWCTFSSRNVHPIVARFVQPVSEVVRFVFLLAEVHTILLAPCRFARH